MAFYFRRYDSPLGRIALLSDGEALTKLYFEDGAEENAPAAHRKSELPIFKLTIRWLDEYFSGRAPDFTPNIGLRGTPFSLRVWSELLKIPFGRTVTYGQLAARIAGEMGVKRMSAQAVGGALHRNPIALIVPCHRVVGADGSLTGYAGGLDRKAFLLEHERAVGQSADAWLPFTPLSVD